MLQNTELHHVGPSKGKARRVGADTVEPTVPPDSTYVPKPPTATAGHSTVTRATRAGAGGFPKIQVGKL